MLRSVTLLLALLALPPAARAQLPEPPASPSDADVARARDLFVQGVEHAQSERWTQALDAFVRSYAASGSPVALFNVASTLRELGRMREAIEAFDRLLAARALDDEMRLGAERLRAQTASQLAGVALDGVPPGEARVSADGATRTSTERPIALELDPGAHELRVELDGYAPWRWQGTLAPGAMLALDADLAPAGGGDALPWILGAVGLAVAGAIVAIVVADFEAQLHPRTALVIALP